MAAMTLTEYRRRLTEYKAAESAVLKGQSYTIKDRTLTRASLREIRDEIEKLVRKINALERGGAIRSRRSVIRDL